MVTFSCGWARRQRHLVVWLRTLCCIACLGLVNVVGCSSGASDTSEPDVSRIKQLTALYASYLNRNADRPPANEGELKQYIAERGDPVLKLAGVSTVDELFVSPRDNEPHVVLYGNEAAKLIRRGVVTHEKTGVNGRRLVGHRMGFVDELDDAEFRTLLGTP